MAWLRSLSVAYLSLLSDAISHTCLAEFLAMKPIQESWSDFSLGLVVWNWTELVAGAGPQGADRTCFSQPARLDQISNGYRRRFAVCEPSQTYCETIDAKQPGHELLWRECGISPQIEVQDELLCIFHKGLPVEG
jgi:hypothetical protein